MEHSLCLKRRWEQRRQQRPLVRYCLEKEVALLLQRLGGVRFKSTVSTEARRRMAQRIRIGILSIFLLELARDYLPPILFNPFLKMLAAIRSECVQSAAAVTISWDYKEQNLGSETVHRSRALSKNINPYDGGRECPES